MNTSTRKSFFPAALIYLLLTSQAVFAQKATPEEQALSSQIDATFKSFFPADKPGGAVLVVKDGRTILRKGYGLAEADKRTPSSPDGIYKVGSITKQFTAAAILLLEEEGKLKVTDQVSKYLPSFPHGDKITLNQLLSHTSGVKSYTSIPAWELGMHKPITVSGLIDIFKDEPLDFEPGSKFSYSNSGYILLGAVVEKASGMKYEDFIEKKVFAKAGMKNSFYGRDDVTVKNAVNGYMLDGDRYVPASPLSMTHPYAAGSLISTVDDLYKWNQAIFAGKVISPKSMEKAFTNYKLPSGKSINYGYGWVPQSLMGVKTIGHGGGINGFLSMATMAPDQNTFVAVLTNNQSLNPEFVASKALALATGVYKEEKPISLPAAELEKYVGVYPVDETTSRTIYMEDGKLFSQRTGGTSAELVNVAKDEFTYKGSFSRAKFKVEGGKAVGMYFGQTKGEGDYFAKSDKPVAATRKTVSLTEAQLKRLEGKYELAPTFAIVVKVADGKIQAQGTGQQPFEIFPTSEYDFFVKVVDAQLEFQKGTDGIITGLVLHQGGQKVPGKKVSN